MSTDIWDVTVHTIPRYTSWETQGRTIGSLIVLENRGAKVIMKISNKEQCANMPDAATKNNSNEVFSTYECMISLMNV